MSFSQDLFSSSPEQAKTSVISISEFNKKLAKLINNSFLPLWVSGEISNLTKAASGHWYFSIKDKNATVRAVMFRSQASSLNFKPELGASYEFYVQPSFYEPRGDFQLRVETMRIAGRGDLYAEFLRLKEQLSLEGLINPANNKPIVAIPKKIGVITSLNAAALHDVLSVLARRAKHVDIVIYPSQVQGKEAPAQLISALNKAIDRAEVDVLLLVRGGGSIEDLWCFNDEQLARTVARSPIPIISGVGHETDFTIADFVADLRAPTPTAAAELCCTSTDVLVNRLYLAIRALNNTQTRFLEDLNIRLDKNTSKLISPLQKLQLQGNKLSMCKERMNNAIQNYLYTKNHRLNTLNQTIQALNPLAVLDRGYALVRNSNGQLVKNALDLSVNENISIEFSQGKVIAEVLKTDVIR